MTQTEIAKEMVVFFSEPKNRLKKWYTSIDGRRCLFGEYYELAGPGECQGDNIIEQTMDSLAKEFGYLNAVILNDTAPHSVLMQFLRRLVEVVEAREAEFASVQPLPEALPV